MLVGGADVLHWRAASRRSATRGSPGKLDSSPFDLGTSGEPEDGLRGDSVAESQTSRAGDHTPDGETRSGIAKASRLPLGYDVRTAVAALGNGTGVISQDTVPFAIWCAARHLGDYEEALWTTVSGLGDRDTTCAIVGGIAALDPEAKIPAEWLELRKPLATMARDLVPGTS